MSSEEYNVFNKIKQKIKQKFNRMHDRSQILLICFLLGIIIILVYGYFRCIYPNFEDPLLFGSDICRFCDLWSISHFVFYMILAFFYPKQIKFIFIIGLLWELTEFIIQKDYFKGLPILSKIHKLSICKTSSLLNKDNHWVYYKVTDIPMNILGIFTGIYLHSKFKK